LDLLLTEWPYFSPMEHKQAGDNALTKKWHTEDCSKVTKASNFTKGVFRISKNIRNLNGFALQQDTPNYTTTSRSKYLGLQVFFVLRGVSIVRGRAVAPILPGRPEDLTLIGLA